MPFAKFSVDLLVDSDGLVVFAAVVQNRGFFELCGNADVGEGLDRIQMRQRTIIVSDQVIDAAGRKPDRSGIRIRCRPGFEFVARFRVFAGANPGVVETLDNERIEIPAGHHRLERRSGFLVLAGARQFDRAFRIRLPERSATQQKRKEAKESDERNISLSSLLRSPAV